MYCLRCGRETDEDQSFCLDCQKEMSKYPIDPNAVVLLPVRRQSPPKKPVKRRITPEEQVKLLKRRVRIYACLLAAALIAVVCLSIPLIRDYGKQKFQIGQNYSTVKPSTEPTVVETLTE
ncbi:MAG: hypothetical protein Q4F81_06505 [Eubacteriales bacterium]|nr:hypothetical protein [Eubacteriales bacterium]